MIRKSMVIAAILLLIYELFLRMADIPWDTSQNDKSANIISAQDFLFNYSDQEISKDTVIVGTSVSRKLIMDSLGSHYISLAFNAWNTYDGLELIKLSRKKPACLLIETNYAKNQILPAEIESNLKPISYYSGKWFRSLQLRYQPTGLLIGWGKNLMKSRIEKLKEEKRTNKALYQLNLQTNMEKMNEKIPDSVLNKRFAVIKSLLTTFKNDNIQIIFFEVPVNEELQHTTSMNEVRQYFNIYFPKTEFRYVPLPADNDYFFSDGVHLAPQSALKYTHYLRNELHQPSLR
jgi:hypothetical protein